MAVDGASWFQGARRRVPALSASALHRGEAIGDGNFGQVCRATWRGRPVAFKSGEALGHEARAHLAMPPSPHITELLAVVVCGRPRGSVPVRDILGLVLEAGDTSLEAACRARGPMPTSLAWEVLHCMAGAISHCEAHGVVHRDLKLENIVLVRTGTAAASFKVIDLGLAAPLGRPDFAAGTFEYMAPELRRDRWLGRSAMVNAAGDVWSAADTAVCSLTYGRPRQPLNTLRPEAVRAELQRACGSDTRLLRVLHGCLQPMPSQRLQPRQLASSTTPCG